MRNVIMRAVAVCLCACLLGAAGCDRMAWPPSRSQDHRADSADEPVAAQESPEQKTIRMQAAKIEELQAEYELLKDQIIKLANLNTTMYEQITDLQFALEKQTVVSESLNDALDQRDRYQTRVNELSAENRDLADQVDLLMTEVSDLQTLLDTLNEQYEQLLDAVAAGPSSDDDADDGDDGDDDDDDDRSRIHFGG